MLDFMFSANINKLNSFLNQDSTIQEEKGRSL